MTGEVATRGLLDEVLAALSLPGEVAYDGWAPGLLRSSARSLPAMVAAVSAALLAVAETDAARRGGTPEPVAVDVRHVAAAATSERFAHLLGEAAPELFAPLSRLWRARDGWVRTHANYPWHEERLLRLLGCDDDPAAVERAVARWDAVALEEAAAARGALAYAVRTAEEWAEHPQGRAVAALPVVTTTSSGGAGRALTEGRFLDGVRVLDLARVLAGPVATRTLAAWGADVLRVDSPRLPEVETQTYDTLSGKRSTELDFATGDGRATLERLLSQADVVVSGYRPGALDRYGLAAGDLTARHPHLTVVTLSAWGRVGPWGSWRGFDSLVQAPTGLAAAEAGDGRRPGALPAQVLDHATGYLAAAAAATSLAGIARGGAPRHAEVSLARTAAWLRSAGTAPAHDGDDAVDPRDYAVALPRPGKPVVVVTPPGRIGAARPAWRAATRMGADAPAF